MKRFIAILLTGLLLSGCGIFHKNQGVTGAASKQEDKQKTKIETIDTSIKKNEDSKLDAIGEWSWGTDYALNQVSNPVPADVVAKDMNLRVQELANKPTIDQVKEMKSMVDMLMTNNANAAKLLNQKDKELQALQTEEKTLLSAKDLEIKKYMDLAEKTAAKADQYKATLGEMDKWLGLGAVWYGLKKFVISSMWILGIGSILFLILRFASMSNPIAAGIFSIFNMIGSWVVHIINVIVPKAVELAGNVSAKIFNTYKSAMTKIVDAIQMAKTTAAAAGKAPSVEDVLNEVEKSMNSDEKAIVEDLKKALNWKN